MIVSILLIRFLRTVSKMNTIMYYMNDEAIALTSRVRGLRIAAPYFDFSTALSNSSDIRLFLLHAPAMSLFS